MTIIGKNLTDEKFDNYADNYFDMCYDLEKVLQRKVDLLTTSSLRNPYFKIEILKCTRSTFRQVEQCFLLINFTSILISVGKIPLSSKKISETISHAEWNFLILINL